MEERNGVFKPFWKPGSCYYGDTLGELCQSISSSFIEFILPFVDTVSITHNDVFILADYGTNDGFSSMPLFCSIIRRLREKHGEKLAVQIIYEDQENNDFCSLFNRMSDADSPVSLFNNVFPLVTNVQFYKQCVPDASTHLIYAQGASHWLEKLDINFKCSTFPMLKTEEEQRPFRQQAERDWTKFLMLRAKELKPGGLLVVVNGTMEFSSPDKGDNNANLGDNTVQDTVKGRGEPVVYLTDVWSDLDAAWKELRDEDRITKEEFERCCLKVILRTAEEVTSPFETVSSPVRQAGLTLVRHDQVLQPCIYKTAWRQKLDAEGVDDRKSFADNMVTSHRVYTNTMFSASLSDMRSEEERAAILEELYSKFHSLVLTRDPGSYRCDWFLSRLVARKC